MKTKINVMQLFVLILIPLVVGGISGFITKDAMMHFNQINKPALSPPGFLFPIVWSILYVLMGISSYLILNANISHDEKLIILRNQFLLLYALSLFFNFFWSIIFFKFSLYYLAFAWLIILYLIVLSLIIRGWKINILGSVLLIPYILWMSFALYLNINIAILN